MMMMRHIFSCFAFLLLLFRVDAQPAALEQCNISWRSQSLSAAESMPCGGGDIGLNVWVENGTLFLYLSQSGMFDENNALLKAGRVRVQLYPNPLEGKTFKQQLILKDGYVRIDGINGKQNASIDVWVDVFNPVIHLDIKSNQPLKAMASYESWRYEDRVLKGKENNANSLKWAPKTTVITRKDSILASNNRIVFFHRNPDSTVFDATVRLEGMSEVKDQLFNPIKGLIFGGMMQGANMMDAGTDAGTYAGTAFKAWKLQSKTASRDHHLSIQLLTEQSTSLEAWKHQLNTIAEKTGASLLTDRQKTRDWWHGFWNRSFVFTGQKEDAFKEIDSDHEKSSALWQAGRNYQLFRYMLGCNAFGKYPTKFNGGLFTCDPVFTDSSIHGTADHRNWGGGTFTAQNQRLVYWPMLKSGDADLMKSQFDFYLQILHNAELRSKLYWQHAGACFSEQMENSGLPNLSEYGWKRPSGFDKGVEYNAWLEYTWDTALEFCYMILQSAEYERKDITAYIPLIESCLVFFDEHYQWAAKQRGSKALDGSGHLILYPGSAAETFKMTYNANSTIAGLRTVTQSLLRSGYLKADRQPYFNELLKRIPEISFGMMGQHPVLTPAKLWERVNNTESPQFYPVFPYGIFGIGKPGLDTALNTWKYDTLAIKFRSHIGWKQDNIFAARLGLSDTALKLNLLKMKNSGRRFPAFWGPGFDWVPDHNWGGSGMIGLQEMLLQTDGKKILLFPSWPKENDVHFKLHAPDQTTVEAILRDGKIVMLEVLPKERMKDLVYPF